jgi:serine/threonine protein kinase
MALASGTRLGPYEIVAPLGAGGMGEVYRAKDTRLDRTVAVKVLPSHVAATPEARQRFEREARAVSSLNHPHICVLHDIGQQDGIDFLVMEYLEGETLAARLTKGPLPMAQAVEYAIQIADALAQAHKQGVFHRDLKPGNIMLIKSGAKLLDFGLAKVALDFAGETAATRGLTQKGTILGTLQYMAPEQLEGKETDARGDIFAFGAVLYEMVTGRKAFEGKSHASLIAAILEHDPPPLSSVQPLTSRALERAVKRCLAKDPDDRWQTARDLKAELQWFTEVTAPAVAPPRGARRSLVPWLVAAVATLAALVLAIAPLAEKPKEPAVTRFSVSPPGKLSFRNGEVPVAV